MGPRLLEQLAYLYFCESQVAKDRFTAEHLGQTAMQIDKRARRVGWRGDHTLAFEPCHIAQQEPWSDEPCKVPLSKTA